MDSQQQQQQQQQQQLQLQQQQQQQSNNNFIEQTMLLLQQSQSTDPITQQQVNSKVLEWSSLPQFNYALAFVLSNVSFPNEMLRTLAGIILKNNIKSSYQSFPVDLKEYLKKQSLSLLYDPSSSIRATATSLISTIGGCEFMTWNELLPTLTQLIVSPQNHVAESAFDALDKICEDLAEVLCHSELEATLNQIVPGFIKLLMHHNPKIRTHALICLNYFIPLKANAILNNVDDFVKALFQLANDQDAEVRKYVCRSLVGLYEAKPALLHPYLEGIIQCMKSASRDQEPQIALEACEFWLIVADNPYGKDVIQKHLSFIIPYLIEKMRFSQEELEEMGDTIDDDYMIPDKEQDIRPIFHKNKTTIGNGYGDALSSQHNNEHDDDNDDDDDETEDEDDSEAAAWTIRKCAAAALDFFAHQYPEEILPLVIPELEKAVASQDWLIKEAAILSLGAIAEGCMHVLAPNMPSLIPYLINSLKDKQPLTRVITCWTIGRYTEWITTYPKEIFFKQALEGLLVCILDNNKRVQESACSAFATFSEVASTELVPYLDSILPILVQCFDKYQRKNLLSLFDAIGTLATAVKHNLNQQKFIDMLIPPIIKKWNSLSDTDQDLFPLLECLSSIAVALGDGFKPYVEGVFKRCLSLIDQCLRQEQAFQVDSLNNEMPNKDFLIASLDLLSGLAEGSNAFIADLIASSNVLEVAQKCAFDPLREVRQSSFALIGDLSKACFHLVKPHTTNIIKAFSENLDSSNLENISVCNNATWALGEVAIKLGPETRQFVHLFINPLVTNINKENVPRTFLDNTAITLGRLGLACPDELAPHLKQFIKPWCDSVQTIKDNEAKDSAFRGICLLIQKNSDGIVEDFIPFCRAITCCDEPQPDLKNIFYELLHCFKDHMGPAWEQYKTQFPLETQQKLALHYSI